MDTRAFDGGPETDRSGCTPYRRSLGNGLWKVRSDLTDGKNRARHFRHYDDQENGKVGSSFDDFLAEQGILEQCEEQAIKQILADQIKAAMEQNRLTKAAMAARMQTSRRALDRLLDPSNTSVTLHTLQRAAVAIGRQLRLELI
jgi:predicted XRE-type DNA-binding protein